MKLDFIENLKNEILNSDYEYYEDLEEEDEDIEPSYEEDNVSSHIEVIKYELNEHYIDNVNNTFRLLLNNETSEENAETALNEFCKNFSEKFKETAVCISLSNEAEDKTNIGNDNLKIISIVLSILECNKGLFKNHIINGNIDNYKKIESLTIRNKIKEIESNACTKEVNIESVLDLMLLSLIKGKLKEETMPKQILFIQDSNVDISLEKEEEVSHKSIEILSNKEYVNITNKWSSAGYKLPSIIVWVPDSKEINPYTYVDSNKIKYVVGYTDTFLKVVLDDPLRVN